MSDPKQLKFQFVVDEAALQKTRQLIRELTTDLQKLAEVASKANIGGGAGGGGSGMLGGMKVGGPTTPEQAKVIAKAPPVGRQLVQQFVDQRQIFKGLADGSKESMRVMGDSLKQAISFQKAQLEQLDHSAGKLIKTYDELGGKIKSLKSQGETKWLGTTSFLQQEQMQVGARHANLMTARGQEAVKLKILEEMAGGAGGGAGGGVPSAAGAGGGGAQGFFSKLFGGGMGGSGPAGVMNLLRGGAWGMFLGSSLNAGLNELKSQPLMDIRNEARHAQAMKTLGVGLRQGDLSTMMAMDKLTEDSYLRSQFVRAANQRGIALTQEMMSGGVSVGGLINAGKKATNAAMSGMSEGRISDTEIEARLKETLAEFLSLAKQSDPLGQYYLGRATSEAGQRVSMMRQLGVGTQGLSNMLVSAANMGYDPGTMMTAFGATRSMGGMAGARANLWKALSAGSGGMDIGLAGQLAGASYVGGGNILGQVAGMRDRGIDLVATERIAQTVLQTIQQSGGLAATGGAGLFGAMGQYGWTGDPRRDLHLAQGIQQGLGSFTRSMGGDIDPYQQGRNLMTAINVLGDGASLHSQNYLAQVAKDPAMLADALAGNVNPSLKLRGISQEQVVDFAQQTAANLITDRFINQGDSSPLGQFANRLITEFGGDAKAMFSMDGAGLQGRKRRGFERDFIDQLGAVYKEAGIAETDLQGAGQAAITLGLGQTGKMGGRGRDASGGSGERALLQGLAEEEKKFQQWLQGFQDKLKQYGGTMVQMADKFEGLGNVAVGADTAAQSLIALAAAADGIVEKLGGKVQHSDLGRDRIAAFNAEKARQEQANAKSLAEATTLHQRVTKGDPSKLSQVSPDGQAALRKHFPTVYK